MAIKDILESRNLKPSKGLGQNFLINERVLEKIVKSAEIKPTDTILEIGPGTGVLTKELAKRAGKVIAIEKDKKIIELLKENLKNFKNVEIIQGDILKINPAGYSLPAANYKIVANLPYYITSPVIRKFLEVENQPELMVLMVQKEVGRRICASPPDMSILAVSVQFYGKPEIISYVSKNSFWPKPKVDSAIIKITPGIPADSKTDADLFFKIVKAGFSQPRKQLLNNFSKILKIEKIKTAGWLSQNKISEKQRAETLSLQDWLDLTKSFNF